MYLLHDPDAFTAAIRSTKISKVEFYRGGNYIFDTWNNPERGIRFISEGSSVSYDRMADARSQCQLNFFTQNNEAAKDFASPTGGYEMIPYSGALVNGEPVWVPMGVFITNDWDVSGTYGYRDISVQAVDRSQTLARTWRLPYSIAEGTNRFQAVKDVIVDRTRGYTPYFLADTTTETLENLIYEEDADPWTDVALALARAGGAELYYDRLGYVVLRKVPDSGALAEVADFSSNKESAIVTPISTHSSRKDIINGVICTSEAPWLLFPVSGEVWDEDPMSPTYRATYGEVPYRMTSSTASTEEACAAAAKAEFEKRYGLIEQIEFDILPDPRLDVGDVVVAWSVARQEFERFILDQLTFDFGINFMRGVTKARKRVY
jgi:hypothetical protein